MASIRDKNEKAAKRLLKSGHASMKELLTVSFGEWPLKGLDINPAVTHDQEAILKPLRRKTPPAKEMKSAFLSRIRRILSKPWRFLRSWGEITCIAGRGTLNRERVIWINKLLCISLPRLGGRSDIVSTLGHEAMHNLQGDHYYRAANIFGEEGARKIWREQEDVTSNVIMQKLADDNYKLPRKSLLRKIFRRAAKSGREKRFLYLKEGVEVQARLHEIMSKGYPCWGKMPQNTDELWSALVNFGLKPPSEIKKHLESLPENSSARDFMNRKIGYSYAGYDIQAVNNAIVTPSARETFWRETLPALYADMIEMYGDRQGRERFGLGPNVKGQIQQAAFGAGKQSQPQPKAA